MNNIRIGKDFRVLWRIFEEDDGVRLPRILEGKSLTLILASPFKKQEITGFSVRENVIEWTFYGKDQKSATSYSLVLIENRDEIGMVTVDKTDAFNLVTRSSMEEIEDNPNLVIETVELESDVAIAPTVEYVPIQIDADTELSETSTNAVENRVITAALKEKQDVIADLESIRSGAGKGATAVQHNELATVAKTGSYSDLKNTPVIPAAVTESTVSGWGFTKDKGQVVVDTVEELEQLDLPKGYLVGVRSSADAYILGETWQRLMKDGEMPEIDLSALAQKTDLDALTEAVVENEEVTAAALNDLKKEIYNAIEAKLNTAI